MITGIFTMMLALNEPYLFIETSLKCKDTTYTFKRQTTSYVGLKNRGSEYYTKYTDLDELVKELNRQCGIK